MFMPFLLSICHCFYKYFKLNDKTQLTYTVLITDPRNHTYPYINNTLNIYLTNQILEQLLFLLFFFSWITNFITKIYYNMITIHTQVTNPLCSKLLNYIELYYMYTVRTSFDSNSKTGMDSGPTSSNNKFVESGSKS